MIANTTNESKNFPTSICIEWNVKDVQQVAEEKFNKLISIENSLIVLEFIYIHHDRCIGINWDVIYCALETLLEKNEITL